MRFADLILNIIGIITPYQSQCTKLRTALGQHQRPKLTIGTVEQFQGSERSSVFAWTVSTCNLMVLTSRTLGRVILMSTVRSNKEFLEQDKRFAIGFLGNAKRFNVAVTRPQAGLIVVGDPDILAIDPLWRRESSRPFFLHSLPRSHSYSSGLSAFNCQVSCSTFTTTEDGEVKAGIPNRSATLGSIQSRRLETKWQTSRLGSELSTVSVWTIEQSKVHRWLQVFKGFLAAFPLSLSRVSVFSSSQHCPLLVTYRKSPFAVCPQLVPHYFGPRLTGINERIAS